MRQRIWRFVSVQPILFLAFVVVLPGVISQHRDAEGRPARVALQGSPAVIVPVEAALRAAHLRVTLTQRATKDTAKKKADVGVVVDSNGEVTVHVVKARGKSRDAYGAVVAALARADANGAPSVRVHRVNLSSTAHGQQLTFARFLPFYVLVQLLDVIQVGVNYLAAQASKRATEPLLVLPFRRSELALGMTMFAMVSGAVSLMSLFVPVAIFDALPFAVAGINVSFGIGLFLKMLFAGALLVPVLAAAGVLVGSAVRTPGEASAFGGIIGIGPMMTTFALTFFIKASLPTWLLALPLIGHHALLTQIAQGVAPLSHYAIVFGASAVWMAALLAPAGRFLARDRAVVRASD